MTQLKRFLQNWWRVFVLVVLLSALGYIWMWWLPALQAWLLSIKGVLGSWADPITTLLGIAAFFGGIWVIVKWAIPSPQPTPPTDPAPNFIVATPETIDQLLQNRLAAPNLDTASKAYLATLVDVHRRLRMTGMGINNFCAQSGRLAPTFCDW